MFSFLQMIYSWLHLFTSLFLHCLLGTSFLCCYRECYRFNRAFFTFRRFWTCLWHYLFMSSLPWIRQFSLEVWRASDWGLKHRLGPSICLNHIVLGKSYYLVDSAYVLGAATDYYHTYILWFWTLYISNTYIFL